VNLARRKPDGAADYDKALRTQERADKRRERGIHLVKADDAPVETVERVPFHQRDLPEKPERAAAKARLAGSARYLWAVTRVHGHRHTWTVLKRSGRGAKVAGAWWMVWVQQKDAKRFAKKAADAGDKKGHSNHHSNAQRGMLAAWAALLAFGLLEVSPLAAVTAAGLSWDLPRALVWAALVWGGTAAVLAVLGRQPTEKTVAATPEQAAVPTPDVILSAFEKTGYPGAQTVGAPSIEGKGINRRLRVIVDLAPAKDATASAVIKKREVLASNLRRNIACVHLAQGGHAGQVILTILDQDPMAGPPVPSPLLTMSEWCLWDAVPWGFDIRGHQVSLPLLWTSLLVGAKPRMGKTFAIRTLVLAAVMDVHCRVYLWDGKGGGDYRMFRHLCVWFGQGHNPKKGQPADCLKMLRAVSDLVADRNEKIDALPTHLRPQGKLTREVSRNPKYGLPLILVVISETQRMLADDKHGADIRNELIALAQNAPSCGVILIVDAQRPTQTTGKGSLGDLPPAMGSRAAFKVMDAGESNVILGDGMAGAGWDSSIFPDDYEGVCLLRSGAEVEEGPKGVQQVKTFYADDTQLEAKCAEILATRCAVSVLDADEDGPVVSLVKPDPAAEARARLLEVFEPDEDKLPLSALAMRLDVEQVEARHLVIDADGKITTIRWDGGYVEGVKRASLGVE
jgi:S-DNA-T family DNA segregation ATPase FtsK/SpoIIIE